MDGFSETDFIIPFQSQCGVKILYFSKKDNDILISVQHRALNWRIVKNSYPLPRNDEILDQRKGEKHLGKIHLISDYHQIGLNDN